MQDLSRRRFLTHSSLGVAMAGALALVPGLSTVLKTSSVAKVGLPAAGVAEPLIAHVRDLTSGEISLMAGANHVIYRDRELAARLYAAARQSR